MAISRAEEVIIYLERVKELQSATNRFVSYVREDPVMVISYYENEYPEQAHLLDDETKSLLESTYRLAMTLVD